MTARQADRLVALYPRRWRARYGGEFADVLIAQQLTLRLVFDVVGGALDAHLSRSSLLEPAKGGIMTALLFKRCAAGSPKLSMEDAWRSASLMIGASLAFAGLYILAKMHLPNKELVDAFGIMAYPAALIVAMPSMYMKNASARAKVLLVGGCLLVLAGISYLTALI